MKIILHWILISVSVLLASKIIDGVSLDPIWMALVVGACLTLFNMFIKPIIKILTLPLNIITFGLFSLVVNGGVFWYLGTIIDGFIVESFWFAFLSALIVSVLNWMLSKVFHFD
jgi:putative membrane protein